MGWIFKISPFFYYQNTPDEERITITSFYMDGPTLSWYQWVFRNEFINSWPAMLQALKTRVAPSFYDDPKGALFKLAQRGIVNEYLTKFKCLTNHIVGLAPPFILSHFIFDLSPEIRVKSRLYSPFHFLKRFLWPSFKKTRLRITVAITVVSQHLPLCPLLLYPHP